MFINHSKPKPAIVFVVENFNIAHNYPNYTQGLRQIKTTLPITITIPFGTRVTIAQSTTMPTMQVTTAEMSIKNQIKI
jgi:hypothetical protein